MNILLRNIGKRYNSEWIFRKVNYEFSSSNNYAILGTNGSGKSTLMQVIMGAQTYSEGSIEYTKELAKIKDDEIFNHLSFASPYLELFDNFTLEESIRFQQKFKPFINNMSANEVEELIQLPTSRKKHLKYFSSGMKQRVRLALAILADTEILLLDEPTSNIDRKSIDWYNHLINEYSKNRLVIVCSNHQKQEYAFCEHILNVSDWK